MRDREQQVVERPKEEATAELPKECRPVRLDDILLDDLTYQLRIEARVADLKQSLEENGQLEPVHLLGPAPYRIVDGFRRCAAAKALGWTEVRAFVHENLDDLQAFKLAFVHNVVRKNLRPLDRANAIRLALQRGLSKLDAAVALGISEKQLGRDLSLLKLPADVQKAIDSRGFTVAVRTRASGPSARRGRPQGATMNPDPSRVPEEFAGRLASHVDTVVHLYCRLLPDHDQKDLAQDALTALVERWRDGSGPAEPFSWLVAVVRKMHARRCRVHWRERGVVSLSAGHLRDDAAPAIVPA